LKIYSDFELLKRKKESKESDYLAFFGENGLIINDVLALFFKKKPINNKSLQRENGFGNKR